MIRNKLHSMHLLLLFIYLFFFFSFFFMMQFHKVTNNVLTMNTDIVTIITGHEGLISRRGSKWGNSHSSKKQFMWGRFLTKGWHLPTWPLDTLHMGLNNNECRAVIKNTLVGKPEALCNTYKRLFGSDTAWYGLRILFSSHICIHDYKI